MPREHNPNCDGGFCTPARGEVRTLPLYDKSLLYLCHSCYAHEMRFRRWKNARLAESEKFDLPVWESLELASNN